MSLLIKALRQAEKQNEQAARQAADVAIDLPPETNTESPQAKGPADQSPLSSALSLAVETHTANTVQPAEPTTDSSTFPVLDEDFAPTSAWQDHADPTPVEESLDSDRRTAESPARAEPLVETQDNVTDNAPGNSRSLALESADLAPLPSSTESPPEMFARHAPEQPSIPDEAAPPTPGLAMSNEATAEAAPYLDTKAALPKRTVTGNTVTVFAGLAAMAIVVAAATAGIMWWSGNQAYDTDFNAPLALETPAFAPANEALSPLDLGVAVSGTADTSSTLANPTELVASAPTQASEVKEALTSNQAFGEATPPANNSPQGSKPDPAPAAKPQTTAPPPDKPAAQAQAPSPSAPAVAANSVPENTSRPALPAVRFVRSTSTRDQSQQLLNDAYQALQRNELTRAQIAYQQALRIDRNLIDGWVGLASVVARQGNSTLASQHYQRALNIDPNDSVARAGLLALAGANLPDESESTLRTLIDSSEQNAMAELALANTLARQGRWAEAQQAYFNANAAQPNQPDIVFNLAVSLDRIRQPRAALRYYEEALNLKQSREALFDPSIARQRIDSLKQQLQEQ